LRKLDELNFEHVMVHTGQNFTPELKDFFFRDLELRKPDYELEIDTSSYGAEVADVIRKSDELLVKVKPDALLILGDTFSGLSIMPASPGREDLTWRPGCGPGTTACRNSATASSSTT
jgi:UDP-N-acetylglucosamine 2-epimerase (non-hydrolysing)